MYPNFHLSIGVKSLEESLAFFTRVLGAKILHRDPSGYVNIDLYGSEITLKPNERISADIPDFHFGVNMTLEAFEKLSANIMEYERKYVTMLPEIWDAGTPRERKKMYLKCPTGYVIELKGLK